jgi:hypothetical protein
MELYMSKKIKIVLYVLFLLSSSLNAKVPFKHLNLDKDPTTAKTLAIVILTAETEGRVYFTGFKGWTFYPSKYDISNWDAEKQIQVHFGNVGEKYVFYSLEKTNEKGELDKHAYSNLISIKSKKAKEVISKLASRQDFIGEINPSWQFCEADSECVKSKNQCNGLIGLNIKYQKNYLDFLKTKPVKTDCTKMAEDKKGKPNQSKCTDNFCS